MRDQFSFNGEILTPETIEKTKRHFVDIFQGCIDEAETGKTKVNDLQSYRQKMQERIDAMMNEKPVSFTFFQRAYWIQTGKSIAMFSR